MDERFADGLVSIGAAVIGALLFGAAVGRLSAPVGSSWRQPLASSASAVALPTSAARSRNPAARAALAIHRPHATTPAIKPRVANLTVVSHRALRAAAATATAPVAVVDMRSASLRTLAPLKIHAKPAPRARPRIARSHPRAKPSEPAAPPAAFDSEPEIANGTVETDPIAADVPEVPSDPHKYVGPHRGR